MSTAVFSWQLCVKKESMDLCLHAHALSQNNEAGVREENRKRVGEVMGWRRRQKKMKEENINSSCLFSEA